MTSVVVWDVETVPDLMGFARANGLGDKTDNEIREAIGDKFPKHIYHSIICIGALVASDKGSHWDVEALGAPHVGDRTEKELISAFVNMIDERKPQLLSPAARPSCAVSCNPRIFVPYDRTARDALRKVWGHKFKDGDYIAYMKAFDAAKDKVVSRLTSIGVTSNTFSVSGKKLDKALFELRATDERLMLAGGFSAKTMLKECQKLVP